MKIYNSTKEFTAKEKSSIITIGTFDGVHIGHTEIIKNLVANVQNKDEQSLILTFFPHPRMVLQAGIDLKLLSTLKEKTQLLETTGLDCLIVEPFTKEFSRLTALEFVRDVLVKRLKLKKLIIGYDHQFGRNRKGNFEQLKEFSSTFGFEIQEIPAQELENIAISSTKIRKALDDGHIEKANSYLGYEYMLSGKIIHGKGLGNKYKYPTVNIELEEKYKLIPKAGVYIIKTRVAKEKLFGIMNIGNRPTLKGKEQTIEVHILDFKADLYGKNIQVNLCHRLRDEQKFESIDDLYAQIIRDEIQAREFINEGKITF